MAQAPLNCRVKPASQSALKCYSNGVVGIAFFGHFKGFDDAFGLKVVHDAEKDFASILFLPSAGIREFAVFEQVVEGDSGRHVVSDNFENAADQIAFNHDDERSIVLIDNVTQGYR